MASTVTRIARANASWPSVASRPLRWGSSEVWTTWKSCSGARVISSALKTTPASAVVAVALTRQHRGVEQRLLGELDRGDRRRRSPRPRAASAPRSSTVAGASAAAWRTIAQGTTSSEASGAASDAQRDRRLPAGEARRRPRPGSRSARPTRTARARRRGRTTGGRRGSRGRSSWPRRRASRRRRSSTASSTVEGVLDRPPQRQRDDEERGREAGLHEQRDPQRVPAVVPARAAVGDRARQQLLDRPVDDRDDDEEDRPQQRDRAVGVGVQHVAGDREVGEGEDARRRDADRQDARAARVGVGRGAPRVSSAPWTVSVTQADEQHRPGERRARLDDLAVARQQRHERALGPVVEVARACCRGPSSRRRGPCSAPRQSGSRGTETSSQRLATRAISATVCSGSGTCSRTSIAVATSNSPSANGRFSAFMTRYSRLGAGALGPLGVQRRVVEVDADDAPLLAQALRPLVREHALAAADVEQRLRVGLRRRARRACPRSRAIRRRTTGLVEPYLS